MSETIWDVLGQGILGLEMEWICSGIDIQEDKSKNY